MLEQRKVKDAVNHYFLQIWVGSNRSMGLDLIVCAPNNIPMSRGTLSSGFDAEIFVRPKLHSLV
jgi:hypothetical protein